MTLETIVATATPPGRGGIAIVRISGKKTKTIAKKILGKLPHPRHAHYHEFKDKNNQIIDEGIALFFPNPNSFTGEDVLELQGHGGPAVVNLLIKEVISLGARLARPGEFSERAFLNNKMDLAQAEAVADLIHATSDEAARASIRSLQGEFSRHIQTLLDSLIHLRVFVEAAIDFAEEEINFLADKQLENHLDLVIKRVNQVITSAQQGSLLRDGIQVVIAGEPNVGKSSLLNALSGNDIAIVTDIPGTTRDILREHIHLDGLPIHVMDTAGLRISDDRVEQEGIRRAHEEIKQADLILKVIDANDEREIGTTFNTSAPILIIRNKIDLKDERPHIKEQNGETIISLSAKSGNGMELLKQQIKKTVGFQANSEGIFSARRRHLDALQRAKRFLEQGQQQLTEFRAGELLAEDLRQAQLALSEITGVFTSDDLLGKIFSSFCIGK